MVECRFVWYDKNLQKKQRGVTLEGSRNSAAIRKLRCSTMQANVSSAREDVFANLPIPAALRKMIVPAISSQLIVLIYNMADTFFVGQTNNPYMVAGTSLICRCSTSPFVWLAWRESAAAL